MVDFGATDATCLSVETPNRVFDRFAHTDLEHCRCVDGSERGQNGVKIVDL